MASICVHDFSLACLLRLRATVLILSLPSLDEFSFKSLIDATKDQSQGKIGSLVPIGGSEITIQPPKLPSSSESNAQIWKPYSI
ncbi:unnamed protein product [Arabidopsis halleri]